MTRKGVWNLQQVRDKYLQSLWSNPNRLFISGNNEQGEMGQNLRYNQLTGRSSPTQISGDWNSVTTSRKGVSAIKDDGTLWSWGYNNKGQLGHNDTTKRSSPTQVPGTTWKRVASSSYATFATKTDGTLWAWGRNADYGTLGQNSVISYSSPVQVGSDTTWDWPVSGGGNHAAAVKTDGTLWTWGHNDDGQLGLTDKNKRSSPVQCSSQSNVVEAQFSANQSYFVSGTTAFSCGANNEGALGHNNQTQYSSPKQIPGTWKSLCGGVGKVGGGVKNNGTLWVWGDGGSGSLGQNEAGGSTNSPIQVGSGDGWTMISGARAGGNGGFLATKSDGTMYKWGAASTGANGLNNETSYSSPIQIPGTLWSQKFYQQNVNDAAIHLSIQSTLTPSQL